MNAPQGNGCLDFWLSLTQIRRYYMFTFCYFEVFVNSILARIGSNFITKSIWIYRIKTLLPKLRSDAIMTRLDASVTPTSVQYGVMKIFWPLSWFFWFCRHWLHHTVLTALMRSWCHQITSMDYFWEIEKLMTRSDKELENQLKIWKLPSLYYKVKFDFSILRIMSVTGLFVTYQGGKIIKFGLILRNCLFHYFWSTYILRTMNHTVINFSISQKNSNLIKLLNFQTACVDQNILLIIHDCQIL